MFKYRHYLWVALVSLATLWFSHVSAGQSQLYEVGIACAGSTSVTSVKYLSADNDFDAQGRARDMLYNNTEYRSRQCGIKYIKNSSSSNSQQKDRNYEVGIVCEGSGNLTSVKYFSAPSDLEAENRARDILYRNTEFNNRRCGVKYLRPS